jgi:molecular chaperone DnaK
VQEAVSKYFFKVPKFEIDPDKVVAIGAAIQGATLAGQDSTGSLLIDVTPLTLGISTVGGYIEQLIERNTPVPTEASKVFVTSTDNQTSVRIQVFQGESKRSEDNEQLGEFVLSGIRSAPRGEVKIMVIFEIDSDGMVNVSAKDIETGKAQSIQISVSGSLTSEEVDHLARKHAESALPAAS